MTPYSNDAKTDFLLLDGSTYQGTEISVKSAVDKVIGDGGTVEISYLSTARAGSVIVSEADLERSLSVLDMGIDGET